MSYSFGILFMKNKYKTEILAISANIFGTIMCFAYSLNPIPKKSAETMFTKLLTTNGKDVVSAIKPLAIIKGNTIFSSNLSALDRKSTRLNSSHVAISYAVFCLKKKKKY